MRDDAERVAQLEDVLAQMLQRIRGVPFSVIVKALAKHSIIPIDGNSRQDTKLVNLLSRSAVGAGQATQKQPIVRPRPNEVGNDIEAYVIDAANKIGLHCARPLTASGAGKSTGYPDILVHDEDNRPTYLECKIYALGKAPNSMRSFYVSPSENFKITQDARHLLMAFGMSAMPLGGQDVEYRAMEFKLVDLHDLLCDVKYEFNSDNRRLYADDLVLASGAI